MPHGRRVRRVVRRVEPWSVLKLSIIFYLSIVMILLVAGALLWIVADAVHVIDNVETFVQDIGFDQFRFLPGRIFRGAFLGGLVLVLVGSGLNVLLTVLYNLISDVVGGIQLVVLEEVPPGAAAPAPVPDPEEGEEEGAAVVAEPAPVVTPPSVLLGAAMPPQPAVEGPPPPTATGTGDQDRVARPSGIFGPSGETADRPLGL